MPEPPERALSLATEFFVHASKQKIVADYQYFVDELVKLHEDDRHKLFYNIAQMVKPYIQEDPNLKRVCGECGSDKIEFKAK